MLTYRFFLLKLKIFLLIFNFINFFVKDSIKKKLLIKRYLIFDQIKKAKDLFLQEIQIAQKNPYGESEKIIDSQVFWIDNQMIPVISALSILGVKTDFSCQGGHDLTQKMKHHKKARLNQLHINTAYLCLKDGYNFPDSLVKVFLSENFPLNPHVKINNDQRDVVYAFSERINSHPKSDKKLISYEEAKEKNDFFCMCLLTWSKKEMTKII